LLCCVLFNSSEHAFVKNSINDWANLGTLIKRHLDQPGHSRCLEMSENFMSIAEGQKDAKTTFVGRQRLTCQRTNLNYLAELI
jgi:hypothetical protein